MSALFPKWASWKLNGFIGLSYQWKPFKMIENPKNNYGIPFS
jgi:hypothetical protein